MAGPGAAPADPNDPHDPVDASSIASSSDSEVAAPRVARVVGSLGGLPAPHAAAPHAMGELYSVRRLARHGLEPGRALATALPTPEEISPATRGAVGTPTAPVTANGRGRSSAPAAGPGATVLRWARTSSDPSGPSSPSSPSSPRTTTPARASTALSRSGGSAGAIGRPAPGASAGGPVPSPAPGLFAPTAPTGQAGPAAGPAVPAVARTAAGRTPSVAQQSAAGALRRMTVAPPRVSIAPRADGPAAGPAPAPGSVPSSAPPVPTVARTPDTGASSLVASTAHLFGTPPDGGTGPGPDSATAGVVRRLLAGDPGHLDRHHPQHDLPGGSPMHPTTHGQPDHLGAGTGAPGGLVRRLATADHAPGLVAGHGGGHDHVLDAEATIGRGGLHLPGDALDALVDAVVERIEERVVDELERRGRRQDWGVL